MNWLQHIKQFESVEKGIEYDFNPHVPYHILHEVKSQFGLTELQPELEEFYRQSNGAIEKYNGQPIGELIWSIEKVIETNTSYRNNADFKELYMSFDQLFFFSDAGNGDLFGFITLGGRFDRRDVFTWNHEDDSRSWVAGNLADFLTRWTQGQIKV